MPAMTQVSIEQAMQVAVAHHQAGRLREAESIYRQVLAVRPDHAEALNLLAAIAGQMGRPDVASDLVRQAITAAPDNAVYHFHFGTLLQNQGRLDEATACYQRALSLKADYPEALINLGNAMRAKGRLDEAITCYQQALDLRPEFVDALYNLGIAWSDKGQVEQAISSYQRVLALNPNHVEAHVNLGLAWFSRGEGHQAVACYQRALAIRGDSAEALCNLGVALRARGQLEPAIDCYRRALSIKPGFVEAHNNLGLALKEQGWSDRAIACFQQALNLNPAFAKAHINIGIVLNDQGCHDQAIACFQRAIEIDPQLIEAHSNLGIAFKDKEQLDQAIACHQRVLAFRPQCAEAHCDLGNAFRANGQIDAAIASFRRALAIKSGFVAAHDDLLLTMLYDPGSDSRQILSESQLWNRLHAEPPARQAVPHSNGRDPQRPLRIGYVSADFMQHPCALGLLPLFRHHDRRQFDIFCYAQVPRPDAYTRQFRELVPQWRNTNGLSDEDVAFMVRQDRIDILVDLKLHTPFNRLPVFAHKPAPVQVTWLGYPGTTGMDAINYRLTDPYLDPPGGDDAFYSERSIRLPDTFWCYDPLTEEPSVSGPPGSGNGFITFGCLNSFCKVNDSVLSLWAQVLKAVPDSRLMLLVPEGSARRRVLDRLGDAGIGPERVEMLKRMLRPDYMRAFHRIDISLDTVPYNGHTTGLDSLWMGVPVVTLVGQTIVGRAGFSELSNLGLPELIAHTPEQYVQIATALAGDLPRLAELRATLRQRMQVSPLMDAPRFARGIEAAYRCMWRTWCQK
jgi:predicted O-linked N-acetylglucosamine transferase (SPINDLY family)